MKILHLGKKKLFGLKGRLGLLRNDMDVEAVTAGLQLRDAACTSRQTEAAHGSPSNGGWIAKLWDDSAHCLTTKAQLKKTNLPRLGITGEGWAFLRTKYRGGQKKAPSSIGLKKKLKKKEHMEMLPKQTVPFTGSSIKKKTKTT